MTLTLMKKLEVGKTTELGDTELRRFTSVCFLRQGSIGQLTAKFGKTCFNATGVQISSISSIEREICLQFRRVLGKSVEDLVKYG